MNTHLVIYAVELVVLAATLPACVSYSNVRVQSVEQLSGLATSGNETEGPCHFNDRPLEWLVEQANRCGSRHIEVVDAAAGHRRLSGAVCVCTSTGWIPALRHLGLTVSEDASQQPTPQ